MGLREAVVLAQVCDLIWVFEVFDFLHDLKPVAHLLAVAFFDSGEVRLATWIFRHGEILKDDLSTGHNFFSFEDGGTS